MTASTADATDLIRARALVARAHAGESIAGVERLADGLTNAVYRVAPPAVGEALSVRVFTTHCKSVSKETAVCQR